MPKRETDPDASALDQATAMLARRRLSQLELESALGERGFDAAEIHEAMERLRDYGYLDDDALAESIQHEALRSVRGLRWVEQTFSRRGLKRANTYSEYEALPQARALIRRRYGELAHRDARTKARAYAFLARRGFTPDFIRSAIDVDEVID
ncbi:MAG: regulatory protein RecX [Myxococcota bacterium]